MDWESALREAISLPSIADTSRAITAIERQLFERGGEELALAKVCIVHALRLLECHRGLDDRVLALRKAMRATEIASTLDDPALELSAWRARTDVLGSLRGQGRKLDWEKSMAELIRMLERAGGDTRRERIHRMHELGRALIPYPIDDEPARFTRDDVSHAESLLRTALNLALEPPPDPDAIAIVEAIFAMLHACHASRAIDELIEEIAVAMPPALIASLRAASSGDRAVETLLRRLADAIEVRPSGPAARPLTLTVGTRVRHATLGQGTVRAAPTGPRRLTEVAFDDGVTRKVVADMLACDA
jgi:hypothetical protein